MPGSGCSDHIRLEWDLWLRLRCMDSRDPARSAALDILTAHELLDSQLEPLLEADGDSPFGDLADARDRRFVKQLVLGCIQWRERLDWILNQFSNRPVSSLSPVARHVLRLGTYQLLWLDRVPSRAAVHSSVELAKSRAHRGVASFVNAVLRRVTREADSVTYPDRERELARHLAIFHSHPQWMVERWLQRWGEQRTESLLCFNNENPRLFVRLNTLRTDLEGFRAALPEGFPLEVLTGQHADSIELLRPEGVFDSAAYEEGLFYVQDVSASLPVALLEPRQEDRILDTCCAPGGKAMQMAIATGDNGFIVAADKSSTRLGRVRDNFKRLGLRTVHILAEDASRPGALAAAADPLADFAFDRILVDAPCSSTGVLGRHPDARWRRSSASPREHAKTQLAILRRAFERLRPDGILVYSTCSLEEEENEQVVDRFIQSTPAAVIEPAAGRFPGVEWAERCIMTLPGRDPGDGSFAARFRKIAA